MIQTEVFQVNDLRANWKAAQVKSRPSIQRQRVRCSQQWISLVIFEAVGKQLALFSIQLFTAWCSWPLSSAHVHALNLCWLHTQNLRTVSSSTLMLSTFLVCPNRTWETVKRTTRKGQSADGMSADLLELSQSKSPHMSVGAGGRTVSYYNQDFRAGLSSHVIFHP